MAQTKRTGKSHTKPGNSGDKDRVAFNNILSPNRIASGILKRRDARVMVSVGGIDIEVLTSAILPQSPAALSTARAESVRKFAKYIGSFVTLRGQQHEGVLADARLLDAPENRAAGDKRFNKVFAAIGRNRARLMALPNVLAIRPGFKFRNGRISNTPCIVVVVSLKITPTALSTKARIPKRVEGVPTDVAPASPLTQYLAQSYPNVSPQALANPLGLLLPEAASAASASAVDAPQAAATNYIPPPNVKLESVSGPMTILCHASPDAGWTTLKPFLDATGKTLTVAMYNFTAPHIVQDLQGVFARKGSLKLLLNPRESLTDGGGGRSKNPKAHDEHQVEVCKDLRDTMSARFDFTWAAVKTKGFSSGGLFPSAYHIKVAVRDSNAMWLSSGNWQSSNQPNLDPLHDPNVPATLRTTYNREWHVLVQGSALPALYEKFIDWDFSQAEPLEVKPEKLARPELLVGDSFGAQIAVAPQFFAPEQIKLTKDDQVVPLLTPDNYAEHVVPLIQGAKKSIRFQNQYISIGKKSNPQQFVALLDALKDRIDAGLDVKIILRNLGHVRDMVESLQTFGMDPNKHLKFIPTCHNKGIIVDDTLVCLGSHNWSGQGTTTNRDASLVFADARIAAYYAKIFDYDWSWATQVVSSESASPQLASSSVEPQGMVRIPWEAYFGDDERIDQVLDAAQAAPPAAPASSFSIQAVRSPLDIANPIVPALHAAKATLSDRYLTSERAIAYSKNAQGISPCPEINVLAVGLGEMVSGQARTGITAVKLFVRQKYPKENISASHLLPTEINGLPVDVEQIGDLHPLAAIPNPRGDFSPAQPGSSVGFRYAVNKSRMAGTFGAVVRDSQGRTYVLSNNHVLADEGNLKAGAPIFQAGLLDIAPDTEPRQIAVLTRFSNLRAADLRVDAAIAEGLKAGMLVPEILYIGAPLGSEAAMLDMTVHKFGRTSQYTVGRVTSVATDVTIDYTSGSFTFKDQIMIEGLDAQPFSAPGDSGSLIINRHSRKAIGLLFAGSPSHTLANHIDDVLSTMAVELA